MLVVFKIEEDFSIKDFFIGFVKLVAEEIFFGELIVSFSSLI